MSARQIKDWAHAVGAVLLTAAAVAATCAALALWRL